MIPKRTLEKFGETEALTMHDAKLIAGYFREQQKAETSFARQHEIRAAEFGQWASAIEDHARKTAERNGDGS